MSTAQAVPIKSKEDTREHSPSLLDQIAAEQERNRAEVAARYRPVMTPDEYVQREHQIQMLIDKVLREGIDYGWVPGTKPKEKAKPGEYEAKPTLFKAGAERVCSFFGYVPSYEEMETIEEWTDAKFGEMLFYYKFRCTLEKDGHAVGQGIASATTWESKYRYRKAERTCPACGVAAIIKGKAEYGGGWLCWQKKGGCGQKYADGDVAIEGQNTDQIANPDVADSINVVQKMAQKRAYVAATLTATGLSGRFTQDLEDLEKLPEAQSKPTETKETKTAGPAHTNADKIAAAPLPSMYFDIPIPGPLRAAIANISQKEVWKETLVMLRNRCREVCGGDPVKGDEIYRNTLVKNRVVDEHGKIVQPLSLDYSARAMLEIWNICDHIVEISKTEGGITDDDLPNFGGAK